MNPYEQVAAVVKRVAQLNDGAPPMIDDAKHDDAFVTAAREVERGLVRPR